MKNFFAFYKLETLVSKYKFLNFIFLLYIIRVFAEILLFETLARKLFSSLKFVRFG